MKHKFAYCIPLLFSLFAKAQSYTEADIFLGKVVMLAANDTGKTNIGSGFFMKKDSSFFVVSAQHVTRSFTEKSIILFTDLFPPKTTKAKFQYLKNIVDTKRQFLFKSSIADVSVIKLNNDSLRKYGINLEKNCVKFDMLNPRLEEVRREFTIMVFGYPLFDISNFSPISFHTNVSSTLIPRYDSLTSTRYFIYYLDNPSMEGCSGGPAVAGFTLGSVPERPMIIGIIKGTVYDSTGGKYAILVPSYYVVKLVDENKL